MRVKVTFIRLLPQINEMRVTILIYLILSSGFVACGQSNNISSSDSFLTRSWGFQIENQIQLYPINALNISIVFKLEDMQGKHIFSAGPEYIATSYKLEKGHEHINKFNYLGLSLEYKYEFKTFGIQTHPFFEVRTSTFQIDYTYLGHSTKNDIKDILTNLSIGLGITYLANERLNIYSSCGIGTLISYNPRNREAMPYIAIGISLI